MPGSAFACSWPTGRLFFLYTYNDKVCEIFEEEIEKFNHTEKNNVMAEKIPSLPSYLVALAGEFAVLSQLALRGYDANMTLGHTKGVDILASDPRTGRMFRLEVKTNHKSAGGNSKLFGKFFSAWIMRKKHEELKDPKLFYCFVNISPDTKQFRFFIVPSHVVADYVREENQLWLGEKESRSREATMRTFRIGTDAERYPIQTPTIEKYENNWDFRE